MTFQFLQSQKLTCPSLGDMKVTVHAPVGTTFVSVGFQNIGNAKSLSASQAFVGTSNSAYVQVVNSGFSNIDFYVWVVGFNPTAEAPTTFQSVETEVSQTNPPQSQNEK